MLGRIEVITGPMYSNKTAVFFTRLENETQNNKKVIIFKPKIDEDMEQLTSEKKTRLAEMVLPIDGNETDFDYILKLIKNYDIIGIDKAHFFGSWIVGVCKKMRKLNKRIIICGLDMNYKGEPFGSMGSLMSVSDETIKFAAICMHCGQKAIYTQRIVNKKPVIEGNAIQIGHTEYYEARCCNCFVSPEEIKALL